MWWFACASATLAVIDAGGASVPGVRKDTSAQTECAQMGCTCSPEETYHAEDAGQMRGKTCPAWLTHDDWQALLDASCPVVVDPSTGGSSPISQVCCCDAGSKIHAVEQYMAQALTWVNQLEHVVELQAKARKAQHEQDLAAGRANLGADRPEDSAEFVANRIHALEQDLGLASRRKQQLRATDGPMAIVEQMRPGNPWYNSNIDKWPASELKTSVTRSLKEESQGLEARLRALDDREQELRAGRVAQGDEQRSASQALARMDARRPGKGVVGQPFSDRMIGRVTAPQTHDKLEALRRLTARQVAGDSATRQAHKAFESLKRTLQQHGSGAEVSDGDPLVPPF